MQKKILKSGLLVIVISLCLFTFFQFEKNQVFRLKTDFFSLFGLRL